jgi:hypothetical protein
MAVAPILALRRAIVTHLRADSTVTSSAVGTRIYGERSPETPTWPFVRYGVSEADPGFDITLPLHVFSKDPYTDDVDAIAEAIAASLDDTVLSLGDGRKAYLTWSGTRVQASTPDEWHAIVSVRASVPRDCA